MERDFFEDEFPEDLVFDDDDAPETFSPGGVAVCQACGCSEVDPCPGGCVWATPELCSRCV